VLAIAQARTTTCASVGVHPDHEDAHDPTLAELIELAAHPKVVAGETGLDYYRLEAARSPTWNGSANAFARISARRPRR
jgi:Tat protein secretion system quality control protein TatD with DNase activity